MNTKDFVVIPWGKPGNSVKLKYKNAQELRMEKVQLELENEEMKKTFQEFQSTRSKEKEEIQSSGYHWKSGKVGRVGNQSHAMSQNKRNAIKFPGGKLKLKLLKHESKETVRPPVKYKMANSPGSEKPKTKGKICGQCEKKAALLVCLECGEEYCTSCFAKIHQKGALKLHRTTLLQSKSQILSSVLDAAHRFIKETNPDESKGGSISVKDASRNQSGPMSPPARASSSQVKRSTTERGECTSPGEQPLCEGAFDESASARSFQEALNHWRAGNPDNQKKCNSQAGKPASSEECEVQTNLKIWSEPINIEFAEDSLSYMEKLWLRKHRRTSQELQNALSDPVMCAQETTNEAQCSWNENDDDEDNSDDEETKIQPPTPILPVEEIKLERLAPSLTIIELDDTCEEELEEHAVPYKVELADSDSQLSFTFPDCQKSGFPYEIDIYQHHITNKGKTDFSSLCLRSSSSYGNINFQGTSDTDTDSTVDKHVHSSDIDNTGENSSSAKNGREKCISMESNKTLDDGCPAPVRENSFPRTDVDEPSTEEKFCEETGESSDCSNLRGRPYLEDSKATDSPLLLKEIALRSKPITEQYQGLERFFIGNKDEKLNLSPSHKSLESNHSSNHVTLTGDRAWVPDTSVSSYVDSVVTSGILKNTQNPSPSTKSQKRVQKSHRPSTANLPLSNSVKKSSCLLSPRPRSSTAPAPSPPRAASAISEIEYIDRTEHNEPSLDNAADLQALHSLEEELYVLRNLADSSERFSSPVSDELPASNNDWPNTMQISTDFFNTTLMSESCSTEDLSFSGKDSQIQSALSFSGSSTDEEEEDFLDKQHVIKLPWSKKI
ncbi:zinc finger B-box domain-containing protein 1 [Perognathus longimembris pacificus]|uniref:zinc finger B-box domain-containing protein 1 n=1 Tax=Perognathus longimembris pacificus TaxID=214514 RepID=UPI002019E18E|nr:zinc finger B-box domain-containing protein 1 [Perognathus longimembris pacificus]